MSKWSIPAVADPTILILVFLSKALSTEVVDLINNASVSINLSLVRTYLVRRGDVFNKKH